MISISLPSSCMTFKITSVITLNFSFDWFYHILKDLVFYSERDNPMASKNFNAVFYRVRFHLLLNRVKTCIIYSSLVWEDLNRWLRSKSSENTSNDPETARHVTGILLSDWLNRIIIRPGAIITLNKHHYNTCNVLQCFVLFTQVIL